MDVLSLFLANPDADRLLAVGVDLLGSYFRMVQMASEHILI